jgi:hypothetical protein
LALIILSSCAVFVIAYNNDGLKHKADNLSARVEILETTTGFYDYKIVNRHGNIIYSNTAFRLAPSYRYVCPTVIEVTVGIGTATWQSIYYDTETDFLSKWYENPATSNGCLVVILSEISTGELAIIIQSIFSESIIASFVRDFSPIANYGGIITSAEFQCENTLSVTYFSGSIFELTTEILRF